VEFVTDLSAEDIRAFSDCVLQIYGHANAEQFPTRVLEAVGSLVRAEYVRFDELDLPAGRHVGVGDSADGNRLVDALNPVFEHFMGEHPLVERFQRTRDGRAYPISGQVSRAAFHRTGLYNEFFRHLEVEDQLVACLPTPPTEIVGLVFNRQRRGFKPRDAQIVNLLRPHLIQAYRNAQWVSRLKTEQERTASLLGQSGAALIALDRDRRIRFCTPTAQALLESYFSTWKRRSKVLPGLMLRWIEGVTNGPPGSIIGLPREPFVHRNETGMMAARLIADSANDGWTLLLQEQGGPLSVISGPDPRVAALPKRLRAVLDCLLEGDSEKEVAGRLTLSRHTVHQYVKMLYRELEVSSRAELMARCLNPTPTNRRS
jgi:DNA-binding CsgD family transcriptional regulator